MRRLPEFRLSLLPLLIALCLFAPITQAACSGRDGGGDEETDMPDPDAAVGDIGDELDAGEHPVADPDADGSDAEVDVSRDTLPDQDSDVGEPPDAARSLSILVVDPRTADPLGGSRLLVVGDGFTEDARVWIGETEIEAVTVLGNTDLSLLTPALPAGDGLPLRVRAGGIEATQENAVDVWSPAELDGARLFDSAAGVTLGEARTAYEWQRLTDEMHPDWRARDGNTTTWFEPSGRFWMIGGWNGDPEPRGFNSFPPDAYPAENTTTEVWSSLDGVDWYLEVAHRDLQFERRHGHNTVVWNDRMWVIGGDMHQGYYNYDVVSSADGVTWIEHLGPNTESPPWEPRGLQISGVFDGKLWTMGGQELGGDPMDMTFFNDVWSSEDGVSWTQVVPHAAAPENRWQRCSAVHSAVEFRGELWLVGCGCDTSSLYCGEDELVAEVWSTADGATWTRHSDPPWAGKAWANVVAWDDKLWILFGYTFGDPANGWPIGNSAEVWYSSDGEAWTSLPHDAPEPGSHGQGVAVHDDYLLYAGGNYSFGTLVVPDKSAWRLVPFRGEDVTSWTERGDASLRVVQDVIEQAPLHVPDAFGPGRPGLQFDGSDDLLRLDASTPEVHDAGRSVFWIARAPYLPSPYGWTEVGAPVGTILSGSGRGDELPVRAIGYSEGQLVVHSMDVELGSAGETVWTRFASGAGLQEGPGVARFLGVTESETGQKWAWIDGFRGESSGATPKAFPPAWDQIGSSMDDWYYGPNTRFAGTLGALVILPEEASEATVLRIHDWARGRFLVP